MEQKKGFQQIYTLSMCNQKISFDLVDGICWNICNANIYINLSGNENILILQV